MGMDRCMGFYVPFTLEIYIRADLLCGRVVRAFDLQSLAGSGVGDRSCVVHRVASLSKMPYSH